MAHPSKITTARSDFGEQPKDNGKPRPVKTLQESREASHQQARRPNKPGGKRAD